MQFDDTDEKTRRNLLVFSALVLAYAWLGYPELTIVQKALGVTGSVQQAEKFAVMALIVQVYLLLRFEFSEAGQSAIENLRGAWRKIQGKTIENVVRAAMRGYSRSGRQPSVIKTDLDQYKLEDLDEDRSQNAIMKYSLEVTRVVPDESVPWRGQVSCTRTYETERSFGHRHGGQDVVFEFPHRERLLASVRTAMEVALYSKFGLDYVPPLALGLCALGFLVYRVASYSM